MQKLINAIQEYECFNEQEIQDKIVILEFIKNNEDVLYRTNQIGHFSSSAWIVNQDYSKVLMVYHNIYQSYSWAGGHADGSSDLLKTALLEANQETGVKEFTVLNDKIFSLEILHVIGHFKNGNYVNAHLHFNLTYLLMANENNLLKIKPDENSDVKWIPIADLQTMISETWMYENIYKKLILKQKKA